MWFKKLAIAVALAIALGAVGTSGAAATPNYDRTCGIVPGSGYVNYVRVKNMTCHHGMKVAIRARKKFCNQNNGCPMSVENDFYRGSVSRNGWKCKVTVAWEYEREKCRKGRMRMVHIAGA